MGGSKPEDILAKMFEDLENSATFKAGKMKLKVHDGMNGHLCYTCKRGQVINKKITYCGWDGKREITRKVNECTWYTSNSDIDVARMEEIAWILKTDERTKKIGFRPLKEVRAENDPD